VVTHDSSHGDHTHNLVPELKEQFPLKWFCEVVGHHLLGGAILDCHFLASNVVGDKQISNVDVSSAFAAGCLTVLDSFMVLWLSWWSRAVVPYPCDTKKYFVHRA
jgi:hypothetical protein